MIGHTQLFLWSRYSDIISLLTITVRGVSNKHCLLPFFIFAQNIVRGYTLELPHCSELDLFKSKFKLTFFKPVYGGNGAPISLRNIFKLNI